MARYHVLIAEDEARMRNIIRDYFAAHGTDCDLARNGAEAVDLMRDHEYDAVLLDVLMPGLDGFAVCRAVREESTVPILFLTALGREEDILRGYALGCDDYVTKPFNPLELIARVKSQLRRYFALGAATQADSRSVLKTGGLVLDKNTKQVTVDGEQAQLTATEYKILELLMEHPGYVFPAEQIYSRVWKEDVYAGEKTVMVHIRRIREKIEITPKNPKYLKVVWGIGYKIEKYD